MNFIEMLTNEELQALVKEPLTSTEEAVAAKILSDSNWNLDDVEMQRLSNNMTLGVILAAAGEQTPVRQALAKVLIKGAFQKAVNMADRVIVSSDVRMMLMEGGELAGVSSQEEILRKVADYHAKRAAERCRFNTQGGGANTAITIDLKSLPSLKGKDTKDIVVEVKRADIVSETLGVQPHSWTELCRVPWPQSLYASGEVLSKYQTLDGRRVLWQSGKKKEITRKGIHLKITARLDEAINPTLMAEEADYVNIPTYPLAADVVVPSVYSLGIYAGDRRFNSQAAKGAVVEGEVNQQPKTEQPKATEQQQQTDEGLSFPIVKEKCKLANGNYKCPRCGDEGLRKKDLMAWQMKKLPDGVKAEDYAEQVKWSGSCICGKCRDELKNEQEQKLAAVTAYEKAVAEWEQAEDAASTARAEEQQLKDNLEALKKTGQDTKVFEASLETYRLNTQKAEAHATELLAKVDSLDPNNSNKTEEPKAEEPEVKEPEQQQPQQQSASANAKAGVTNVRTKKGGRKGRK